jgi:hypothetical protein
VYNGVEMTPAFFLRRTRLHGRRRQLPLRCVRRIASGAEHHSDRVTKDNPAAASSDALRAPLNEALRIAFNVVGAKVDVSPYGRAWVVVAQPLEEQLHAGAGGWVQLAREFVPATNGPSPG